MGIEKDFLDTLNTKANYENFSEEVEILQETAAGKMAVYTIKNKNGVTFQKVPGQPGLEQRGFMGFVQGDRSRPIMLSGSVKVSETATTDNTITDQFPKVDLLPGIVLDIQLTASQTGETDNTKERLAYITVF